MQVLLVLLLLAGVAHAEQAAPPVSLLDVPYISQSEALCGGAAAAMVLRYWGAQGLDAESFAHLVDRSAAGIRTDALTRDITARGWTAMPLNGDAALLAAEMDRGRPVLALIADRPGTYHYIVIVAAQERGIIFHDPARAPFRVMPRDQFMDRWRAAGSWMMVVVPGLRQATAAERPRHAAVVATSGDRCADLIAGGVRAAQANDLPAAEQALTNALACPGPSARRELAGVRLLQRRWAEVSELAAAALAEDPGDEYSWKLLGTSRYVQDDDAGALAAWNRAGEPRIDLVQVDGLVRTRHRVVERLVGARRGEVLTPGGLTLARRRLQELPSALATRVAFESRPAGLASVRGAIVERPLLPSGPIALASLGLSAAISREVRVSIGSLTGGGERLSAAWRFWPGRPRLGVSFAAPAPWGGTWAVDADAERQPFDVASLADTRRKTVRVTLANWMTSALRAEAGGGIEQRDGVGRFGIVAAGVSGASGDDRLVVRANVSRWAGGRSFSSVRLGATARSTQEQAGFVWLAQGALHAVSDSAPLDLWPSGDTGHARDTLLRAHPVLDFGRLRSDRLGRMLANASVEARRWHRTTGLLAAAGALFVDTARAMRRLDGLPRGDVDVGVGVRIAIAGIPGFVRIDLAKGLRDGATALSVAFVP